MVRNKQLSQLRILPLRLFDHQYEVVCGICGSADGFPSAKQSGHINKVTIIIIIIIFIIDTVSINPVIIILFNKYKMSVVTKEER